MNCLSLRNSGGGLEGVAAARVAREPALVHALLLLEGFEYGPEAGERGHPQQRGHKQVVGQQGTGTQQDAGHKKHAPYLDAKVVLALDDKGVKHAYDEKRAQAGHEPKQVMLQ